MPEEPEFDGSVSFFVEGLPAPGGSKNAFAIKKRGIYTGRVAVVDAGGKRNKEWRYRVRTAAIRACLTPFSGAVKLEVTFFLPRPRSHYRTWKKERVIRESAPLYHTHAPDATKLLRSTEDAMKAVAWFDDSQVVMQHITKQYEIRAQGTGALIRITPVLDSCPK